MLAIVATDFGKRVAAARKHARRTQKQLAPLVGMSQSNLSELETVAHESGKTAQLAYHCGVNAYWLATGEGDMLTGAQQAPAARPPDLAEALPVVLGRLPGLDDYTARKVVSAVDAAIRGQATLEQVEADLLQWLQHGRASASAAPAAKRTAAG